VKITTVRIPETEMGNHQLDERAEAREPNPPWRRLSNSLGMDLKNPISSQIENGTVKVG